MTMLVTNEAMNNPGAQGIGVNLRNELVRLNWIQHRRFAQEIADLKLTVPQFYTLSTLMTMGGSASMGDLARATHQVSATMTGIIDRLVRDGLVERQRSDEDRRSVVVAITPAGQELVDTAWGRAMNALENALQGLSREEEVAAYHFVERLNGAMMS